jgi:membrane-bound lytic murein transglycosylase D
VLQRTQVRAAKGDNVASIARKHKVNPDQVAQWNKVGMSASFKPGQQVVLFLAASQVKKKPVSAQTTTRKPQTRQTSSKKSSATRVAKR